MERKKEVGKIIITHYLEENKIKINLNGFVKKWDWFRLYVYSL